MNWLLIVILLTLLIFTVHGYAKGFIRIVFSLVSVILLITFVAWATPQINTFLEEKTSVYESVLERCEKHIQEKAEENEGEEAQSEEEVLALAGLMVPVAIQEHLIGKGASVADELMEESGIYALAAKSMAGFIVHGIAFLMALIAALVVLGVIASVLNLFSKLPIIRGINRFFGLFAGLLEGLIAVWIFMYIVAVCCTNSFGQNMIQLIDESWFLTYLYNNNGLIQFTSIFF